MRLHFLQLVLSLIKHKHKLLTVRSHDYEKYFTHFRSLQVSPLEAKAIDYKLYKIKWNIRFCCIGYLKSNRKYKSLIVPRGQVLTYTSQLEPKWYKLHAWNMNKESKRGISSNYMSNICHECVPYSDKSCPIPAAAAVSTGCALAVWKWSLQVLLLVWLSLCVWARRLTAAHRRRTENSSSGARPVDKPNTSKSAELGSNVVQDQGKVQMWPTTVFTFFCNYLLNEYNCFPPSTCPSNVTVFHPNSVSCCLFFHLSSGLRCVVGGFSPEKTGG